ncbi:MAG: polysaccharide biosynthesis tyrosine autokinase [Actinomycetota bacterium]
MSTRISSETSVEMGDYMSVIRRRKLLIAAMTLAGLALALFYSVAVAKQSYVSNAKVLVRPITSDVTPDNVERLVVMGTEREIATSADVATIAKERMKAPATTSISSLQKKLTVSVVGTTQFLNFACSDKTKLGAQTCAQAFADAYLQYKAEEATKNRDARVANANAALNPINAQIVEATKRLAAAPVGSPAQAEAESTLDSLQQQGAPYRQVLADMAKLNVNDAGAVVSAANRPGAPASPKPKTNAILGAFFGLFLGLLVAFGRDRVDNRLRGRVDLEEYLRAPVLATVPRTRRNGRTAPTLVTMQHPNSPASEAYRALRTRVLVMAERQGLKTIMVASPTGEDGKTAIAANLAVSLAQVGKRVVLLSADLRGSKVHQYFGLDNERGLSNVLAGEMPPWEAVQEPAGLERLWVFGSGPVPAQPAELLQSDLMRELLAERRKVADFVIIEAPAALNASDCLALAPLVDGILVVADAKHTDRDEVEQVRIQFEQVGGQVVGAVMSNAVSAR